MKYELLNKAYYKNFDEYNKLYNDRFNNEFAIHLNLDINGNPAFFMQTPDLYEKIISIIRNNMVIDALCQELPPKAISQYATKCLIDEIIITNNIEGVHSTRKEINEILNNPDKSKRKRFRGLVNRYNMLGKQKISLSTCEDIRAIYDELALQEISEDDPDNIPDGKLFRKSGVNVHTVTDKIIHSGLTPESKIQNYMCRALDFLNDTNINIFFRISVFHYLFGYIHPFYDGNGRTSRFISSYLLASEINFLAGYRLSYTIKEDINKYYKSFKICNDPKSKGDLTPFISMFLDVIESSTEKLIDSLGKKLKRFSWYTSSIFLFPNGNDKKFEKIYYYLIQASLFSESGIQTSELLELLEISRATLKARINQIPDDMLIIKKEKSIKCYSLSLEYVDNLILDYQHTLNNKNTAEE